MINTILKALIFEALTIVNTFGSRFLVQAPGESLQKREALKVSWSRYQILTQLNLNL